MEAKQVKDLMEAYASVYSQQSEQEVISEDLQQTVEKGLDAAAKNPVIRAIGNAIAPVRPGRKTPTKESGGYRPVVKSVKEDVDTFDVVKDHLMSEGYADTEEAAIAIMANMSEEWKQSIVEGWIGQTADNVARTAGTVVGTVEKGVDTLKQKVQNVKGTFDYARDRARDGKSLRSPMTKNPTQPPAKRRSREFDKELPFGVNPGGPDFGR